MNVSRPWFSFVLVVSLTVLVLGWVGQTTWSELQQLRRSFAAIGSDSFHLSDYIEGPIGTMNDALLQYASRREEASRQRFAREGGELKQRLRNHDGPPVLTPEERQILVQINRALDFYMTNGMKLMDEKPGTASKKPMLDRVDENAAPVLALCDKLTEAERNGLAEFMGRSRKSLLWVEGLLVGSWLLLVGFGVTLSLSVYHQLVSPLRRKLQESRAVIEHHEKLASLGTLAAGVAHEIRNPLTAINVRVHSLKRHLVAGSSEHEDATVISSEIKRLEGIVQAFLQFARPAEPKFVTVSADSLLTRVRALLGGQLEKAGIQLGLESPPDLWVRVDPQQVEQVLINLVQNAAESIERDGAIALRARTEIARLAGGSVPAVVLEVSDTGKGIPPEVQKRLFDPFFTTKREGTGLGLSIAARIIEQQGGVLRYTTQLNKGTTFRILLPRPEQAPDGLTT